MSLWLLPNHDVLIGKQNQRQEGYRKGITLTVLLHFLFSVMSFFGTLSPKKNMENPEHNQQGRPQRFCYQEKSGIWKWQWTPVCSLYLCWALQEIIGWHCSTRDLSRLRWEKYSQRELSDGLSCLGKVWLLHWRLLRRGKAKLSWMVCV